MQLHLQSRTNNMRLESYSRNVVSASSISPCAKTWVRKYLCKNIYNLAHCASSRYEPSPDEKPIPSLVSLFHVQYHSHYCWWGLRLIIMLWHLNNLVSFPEFFLDVFSSFTEYLPIILIKRDTELLGRCNFWSFISALCYWLKWEVRSKFFSIPLFKTRCIHLSKVVSCCKPSLVNVCTRNKSIPPTCSTINLSHKSTMVQMTMTSSYAKIQNC